MHTREKIKQMRKRLGISAQILAERIGVSKATLYRYESGDIEKIPMHVLEKIAAVLDCNILSFTEKEVEESPSDIIFLPIVGRVSAGVGSLAEQYIEGYESTARSSITEGTEYIYLRVTGDSMYPIFIEGDLVLVQCQPSVDSGNYAVVVIDDCDGVIKKIVYSDNFIELHSINPMYPIRRFEGADMRRVRVCGLVKEIKRKF